MHVDLILLSRDLSTPRRDVWDGIMAQSGVVMHVHRVTGPPRPGDVNRHETIARARNQARNVGRAPWVMLLDDDVVLAPDCLARLVEGLEARPEFAALAADSDGQMRSGLEHWDYPSHVGMAAVMFRRERLAGLNFRWKDGKCECLCCCEDLRAASLGIGYLSSARAWHRPSAPGSSSCVAVETSGGQSPCVKTERQARAPGHILTAFDRRDYVRFRTHFLSTLRAAGNHEQVWAFAYGLFPSERARLEAQEGVRVIASPGNRVSPALRRLKDFQRVVADLPGETPVAYWDAGDVLFQGSLGPLWDLTAQHPGLLLAVVEPRSYPDNPAIPRWCDNILDPAARERAFELLSTNVFLNSGFAAGTASAVLDYLRAGERLLDSPALRGVAGWGDQLALNLYCHGNPDRWRAIDPAWNYTLAGRHKSEYTLDPSGKANRHDKGAVHILHGNAKTLRWLDFSPSGPAWNRNQAELPAKASVSD